MALNLEIFILVNSGDIYFSKLIKFYDRRLSAKGYHEYGLGSFDSTKFSVLERNGLKPGVVCSGDSFNVSPADYSVIINNKCKAIDMESAGVAWVAMLTKTPMFALKGTNDIKGKHIHEQFHNNFKAVTYSLATKLKEIIGNLDESSIIGNLDESSTLGH